MRDAMRAVLLVFGVIMLVLTINGLVVGWRTNYEGWAAFAAVFCFAAVLLTQPRKREVPSQTPTPDA